MWAYIFLSSYRFWREADYPYTGSDDQCKNDGVTGITTISSYGRTQGTSAHLARLAQQPINMAVNAANDVFRTYSSGIITASSGCPTADADHAVLAVGYGTDSASGLDYWLVKNSWNTTWGDQGYIKIAIVDGDGICGVQMDPQTVQTN